MVAPITSPVVNRPGSRNRFDPLASSRGVKRSLLNFVENFAAEAPPEVFSKSVLVNNAPLAFGTAGVLPSLVDVLQLSLPIPMPIGLTLGAYSPVNDRFRRAARFPAIADINAPVALPSGRYVIEWGLGKARNYAYTDLAPGSLQIPVADSLRVSAFAFGPVPGEPVCIAGASAYPGLVTQSPEATFTHMNFVVADTGPAVSVSHEVPPFARSFHVGTFGANDQTSNVFIFDENNNPVGIWAIVPSTIGVGPQTDGTRPYGLADVILTGSARLMASTLYEVSDFAHGAVYTTEIIRL